MANKSLVGEYDSAWEYVLAHYQGEPAQGSAMAIRDELGDRTDRQYENFPTALEALLERTGYL